MLPLALTLALSHASDFMDVWISTAFEDDNVFAGPDAQYRGSPSANFVQRGNNTFFENYEIRVTDDISRSNLVLYRRDEGTFKDWWTEAAFVLRYNTFIDPRDADSEIKFQDDGSYVRIVKNVGGDEDHTLSLTGFAINANRFALGYSYDLAWGGTSIFVFQPRAVPGARLQWQKGRNYAFLGLKSALGSYRAPEADRAANGSLPELRQAYYGVLAGGGLELGENARVEVGVGSFQQGQIVQSLTVTDPLFGEPIVALGGAAQFSVRTNSDIRFIESQELKLYRNSPDFVRDSYINHQTLEGFGVLVQAEVDVLSHNLLDPLQAGATVVETGVAGDVQSRFIVDNTQIAVDLVYKDLPYIVFNVPGVTSGVATNPELPSNPQLYSRMYLSHYLPKAHVTPSLGIGIMQPASFLPPDGEWVIVYSDRQREEVPKGSLPSVIASTVAGVQVDMSKSVVVVGEVLYTRDPNRSIFVDSDTGGTRVAAPSVEQNQVGMNVIMRARF